MAAELLYFRADGCGVCHVKEPVAREAAERLDLPFAVLDTEREPGRSRAEALRIPTVPTLALVEGQRVPFRLVGRMITPENIEHLVRATRAPGESDASRAD